MRLFALDPYQSWGEAVVKAALARGWQARMVKRGRQVMEGEPWAGEAYGFIRLSMEPPELAVNRNDYDVMASCLTMVQDRTQIDVYENKSSQFARWAEWMPETWRFTDKAAATDFIRRADFPLVSKADNGASSVNVRILQTFSEAQKHIDTIWGRGIPMERNYVQRDYVLFQRCIPHTVTYRVNILGRSRAIFFRYNYPDRMVAQTGNVEPAMALTPELESLLDFADRFAAHAGTLWCALDILKDGSTWRLLETSEGWPWPSPGTCNEGTIFRSTRPRRWIEMFEVLLDEIEAGVWSSSSGTSRTAPSPSTSLAT